MKIQLKTALVIILFLTQNSFAGAAVNYAEPEQSISKQLNRALVDYATAALLTVLDTNRYNFLCTESILEKMDSDMETQINGLFVLSQASSSAIDLNASLMKKIKLNGVLKMKTPELRLLLQDMYPKSSMSLGEPQKCLSILELRYKAK